MVLDWYEQIIFFPNFYAQLDVFTCISISCFARSGLFSQILSHMIGQWQIINFGKQYNFYYIRTGMILPQLPFIKLPS